MYFTWPHKHSQLHVTSHGCNQIQVRIEPAREQPETADVVLEQSQSTVPVIQASVMSSLFLVTGGLLLLNHTFMLSTDLTSVHTQVQ